MTSMLAIPTFSNLTMFTAVQTKAFQRGALHGVLYGAAAATFLLGAYKLIQKGEIASGGALILAGGGIFAYTYSLAKKDIVVTKAHMVTTLHKLISTAKETNSKAFEKIMDIINEKKA